MGDGPYEKRSDPRLKRIGDYADVVLPTGEMRGSLGWPGYSNGRVARWLRGGSYIYCDERGWLASDERLAGTVLRWFRSTKLPAPSEECFSCLGVGTEDGQDNDRLCQVCGGKGRIEVEA